MLTCVAAFGGFLLVAGVGGLIVERTPIARWLDHFAHDLPMNFEFEEPFSHETEGFTEKTS